MGNPGFETQNLTRGCNELLILGVLTDGKKHGYQLALELEERSDGFFRFNHGTLYPILHKLEKDGLIRGQWKEESSRRKRKLYSLTAKGRKRARARVVLWRQFFERFFTITGEMER